MEDRYFYHLHQCGFFHGNAISHMVGLLKTDLHLYWAFMSRRLFPFTRTLNIAVFEISLILYQSKGNQFISSDI